MLAGTFGLRGSAMAQRELVFDAERSELKCTRLTPCSDGCSEGAMCVVPPTAEEGVCVVTEAIVCCDMDADCSIAPTGASRGACAHFMHPTEGTIGICLPPTARIDTHYCSDDSADRLRACHLGSDDRLVPWPRGDCDRDGVRNEDDACVCTAGVRPRAGCPASSEPDGGPSHITDGGSSPADASMIVPDGGVGERDARGDFADASDEPRTPPDFAEPTPLPSGHSFRGGGGCACDGTRVPQAGWWPRTAAGMLLLALALRARSSSRRRVPVASRR
ncbi:MAG: hypothetical protein NZ898_07540 [Myxococcota bacterium]|nr:hypothetical protein [Myxococcota bacterium]